MKTKVISIFAISCMAFSAPVFAEISSSEPVPLQVSGIDPTGGKDKGGTHKHPVRVPSISLDDHTLYFFTPCDGCVLNLVDENGVVVYSLVIPEDTASLELPAELSGEYELQIVRGNYCFWGYLCISFKKT